MRASITLLSLAVSAMGWNIALYDTTSSSDKNNYYFLEGSATSEDTAGCITLPKTIPSDVTSCTFYTDGGFSNEGCSEGSFVNPSSYTLDGGQCAVYHGGECTGDVSVAAAGGRSDVYNPSSNWGSCKCWTV